MIPKIDRHKDAQRSTHTHFPITFHCALTRTKCFDVFVSVSHKIASNNTMTPDIWRCNAFIHLKRLNLPSRWTQNGFLSLYLFRLSFPIYPSVYDIWLLFFFWGKKVYRCLSHFLEFIFMFVYVYFNIKHIEKSIEMAVIQWDFKGCALSHLYAYIIHKKTHKTITSFIVALAMNHAVVNGVFR